jgi:hypothetical protein
MENAMKAIVSLLLSLSALTLANTIPAAAQMDISSEANRGSESPQTTPAPVGPSGIITLVAGNGYIGDTGNGGLGTQAQLALPQGVAVDSAGNVYIADQYAAVVRKVTAATGIISIYAGTGFGGYSGDGGPALKAQLDEPLGLALDAAGDLYIADSRNNVIRKVTAKTGIISTVAGDGQGAGAGGGDGCGENFTQTGPALYFALCAPNSVALDSAGNLYIVDAPLNRGYIREVNAKTGILTTVVGGGYGYSGDGGKALAATLADPAQIAIDKSNNLYIADSQNCAIRKVTASTGIISSLVGKPAAGGFGGTCSFTGFTGEGGPASKAGLSFANGVAVDAAGNVYIADGGNTVVHLIAAASQDIYTIAGSYEKTSFGWFGEYGFQGYGGPATQAELDNPGQLATDANGNLFGADPDNAVVFKVAGAAALPTTAPVISPTSQQFSGNLKVTITNPVANSTLYYTLDGTLPNSNSTKYTGPIVLNNETAIVTAFSVTNASTNVANGSTPQKASAANSLLYGAAPPAPIIEERNVAVLPIQNYVSTTTPINIAEETAPKSYVSITNSTNYYSIDGPNAAAGVYQAGVVKFRGSFFLESGSHLVQAVTCLQVQVVFEDYYSQCIWSMPAQAQFSVSGPAAPAVTTKAATGITADGVHLNGTVNPRSTATEYWVVYGEKSNSLTGITPVLAAGAGNAPIEVSIPQSGLKAKTTYYYRLVAQNSVGNAAGEVMSFTTP